MKRGDQIQGIVTGLILAVLFLWWSFEVTVPDDTMALILGATLVGGTAALFLILRRSGSRKDDSKQDDPD